MGGGAGADAGAGEARPLQLLRVDEATGAFELGEDALEALSAADGPVGVVAVCGRARQGKSYVLNRLLGRSSGFTVGPTVRPCTKGLWMWSSPVRAADGTHLVLLDSEGIDAYDQTAQYATQIFSLAVLLSSTFVYNQMGGIDEAALDRLALVTEMTKHVRVRSGDAASADELGAFSPELVWLLRDFYLDLEDDGRAISTGEYLERALRRVPGGNPSADAKNLIRDSITALFPRRDCVALVRPCADEKVLRRLDEADRSQLRPEFLEGLDALADRVLRAARPKEVDGCVVTGPALAALARAYVGAINAGAVPAIATAWQGVAEAQCREAVDAALGAYDRAYAEAAPAPEEADLGAAHRRAAAAAADAFGARAMGSAAIRSGFEARLRAECERRFEGARELALAQADAACGEALVAAAERVRAAAAAGGADSVGAVADAVVEASAAYEARAVGPTKLPRLVAFLRAQLDGAVRDAAAVLVRRCEAAERERSEAEARAAEAEAEKGEAVEREHARAAEADDLRQQLSAAAEAFATKEGSAQAAQRAAEEALGDARADLDDARARAEAARAAIEAARERMANTEARAAVAVEEAEGARGALEDERRAREAAEAAAARAAADAAAADERAFAAERAEKEVRRALAASEAAERAASELAAQEAAAAAVCAQREARMAAQLAKHLEAGRERKARLGQRVRRWAGEAERIVDMSGGGGGLGGVAGNISGSTTSVAVAAAAAAAQVLKAGRRHSSSSARSRGGEGCGGVVPSSSSSGGVGAVVLGERSHNTAATT